MMLRFVLAVIAWGLAIAVLYAAFSGQAPPLGLPLWQLHIFAAAVCGVSTSSMIAWRRPYLYGLFVVLALLIPVVGPLFVLLLGVPGTKGDTWSEGRCQRPVHLRGAIARKQADCEQGARLVVYLDLSIAERCAIGSSSERCGQT